MTVFTPEFLQTKTYSALRDRVAFQHGGGIQAGTWDMGDFIVSQRSSGANMSVDVSAGFALVPANDPGNAGLYHVQNDATVNVPQATAAHATLPRLDKLILLVTDTTHGGDASDAGTLQWVTGTATAGTTLDNGNDGAHGAGAIPTGGLLLADVLVPAAATTMTTANIRDRRPSARLGWFTVAKAVASGTSVAFSGLTLWGGVDHVQVVGRIRSTRATFASTGARFTVNGITTATYFHGSNVDFAGTGAAAALTQSSAIFGAMPAATADGLGTFEISLPYVNTLAVGAGANLNKHYSAISTAWVSAGSLFINNRAGGVLPSAMTASRLTALALVDDVGSVLDASSHAELRVYGG